jgi:hypothetical protein
METVMRMDSVDERLANEPARERIPVRLNAGQGWTSITPLLFVAALLTSGCQVVRYVGPNGERFSRLSFGATTAISALTLTGDTNGVRRLELQGYQNDSSRALGAVTEAAIRAAIQGAR